MGLKTKLAAGAMAGICALCTPVIAYYEGYVPQTYADPVGIPTVCYGHTGAGVVAGQTYTRAQCGALLSGDVRKALDGLQRCVDVPLQANEWAALTSLAYNAGVRAVCRSTMVRMIEAGQSAGTWCAQFSRWVYARGRVLPGLVKRRAAERALCEGKT